MVTFIEFSRLRRSSSVKSSAYAAGGVAVKKMLRVADVMAATTTIKSRGLSSSFFIAVIFIYLYQKSVILYEI